MTEMTAPRQGRACHGVGEPTWPRYALTSIRHVSRTRIWKTRRRPWIRVPVICRESFPLNRAHLERGAPGRRINTSIRSAILCAGSRSYATVQSAALPSVASLGQAWFTRRSVSEGDSSISRPAAVLKQFRRPRKQNFVPPVSPTQA